MGAEKLSGAVASSAFPFHLESWKSAMWSGHWFGTVGTLFPQLVLWIPAAFAMLLKSWAAISVLRGLFKDQAAVL